MSTTTNASEWFTVKATITEDGEVANIESHPMSRKAADKEAARLTANGWTVTEIAPHVPAKAATRRGPKKMTAKFQGSCKDCGNYFSAGSTIYFMRETGALCPLCSARWYARAGWTGACRNG